MRLVLYTAAIGAVIGAVTGAVGWLPLGRFIACAWLVGCLLIHPHEWSHTVAARAVGYRARSEVYGFGWGVCYILPTVRMWDGNPSKLVLVNAAPLSVAIATAPLGMWLAPLFDVPLWIAMPVWLLFVGPSPDDWRNVVNYARGLEVTVPGTGAPTSSHAAAEGHPQP